MRSGGQYFPALEQRDVSQTVRYMHHMLGLKTTVESCRSLGTFLVLEMETCPSDCSMCLGGFC